MFQSFEKYQMPSSQSVWRAVVTPFCSKGNQLLPGWVGAARDGRWRERGQRAGEDALAPGQEILASHHACSPLHHRKHWLRHTKYSTWFLWVLGLLPSSKRSWPDPCLAAERSCCSTWHWGTAGVPLPSPAATSCSPHPWESKTCKVNWLFCCTSTA